MRQNAAIAERIQPFTEDRKQEDEESLLVTSAQSGDRSALEGLVRRHQPWIFNISLRMLSNAEDAEDATQEILVLIVTRLSTFQHRSRFRTWLYRIAVNHLLSRKRGGMESQITRFSDVATQIDTMPVEQLADPRALAVDQRLLEDEVRIGCTSAMLLCLNREQRMAYILGEILGVKDRMASELLDITPAGFRKRLSRARRDLYNFMNDKCGLVKKSNPCRCAGKTQGLIRAGLVDPDRLQFARERVTAARELAPHVAQQIDVVDRAYAEIFRDHPFDEQAGDSADQISKLTQLVDSIRTDPLLGR